MCGWMNGIGMVIKVLGILRAPSVLIMRQLRVVIVIFLLLILFLVVVLVCKKTIAVDCC